MTSSLLLGPSAMHDCGANPFPNVQKPPLIWASSWWWDRLIHPITNTSIRAVMWYQGEASYRHTKIYRMLVCVFSFSKLLFPNYFNFSFLSFLLLSSGFVFTFGAVGQQDNALGEAVPKYNVLASSRYQFARCFRSMISSWREAWMVGSGNGQV